MNHLNQESVIVDSSVIETIMGLRKSNQVKEVKHLLLRLERGETTGAISSVALQEILAKVLSDKGIEATQKANTAITYTLGIASRAVTNQIAEEAYKFQAYNKVNTTLAIHMALAKKENIPLIVDYEEETVKTWTFMEGITVIRCGERQESQAS